ncbi:MAG: hypothetical protein M5U09_14710 [Gammaproteobacteria bacterium]|nr:hypothetical protein [Gammaproteobacteria bacterium]
MGVAVSGAGASATNYILTSTNAAIDNVTIVNADDVDLDAVNTASINAVVAAASAAIGGGAVGVGASVGVSLSRNLIGYKLGAAGPTTYTTGDTFNDDHYITHGQTVPGRRRHQQRRRLRVHRTRGAAGRGRSERRRQGPSQHGPCGGRPTSSRRRRRSRQPSRTPAITAGGTLSATADSDQQVNSAVLAGSVAVGAGSVGVGVSGAGVSTENRINTYVEASITGDSNDEAAGITVGAVDLDARDDSTITANAGAASIAAGFGFVGVSVSLGVAIATNEISNTVRAFISGVDDGIRAFGGDVDVHASDTATMTVNAVAASLAVAGGFVGVALAGAGSIAPEPGGQHGRGLYRRRQHHPCRPRVRLLQYRVADRNPGQSAEYRSG